jgi:hypothetical protein
MNIISLAKAIGIVLGSITAFISFLLLLVMYKSFAVIFASIIAIAAVISLLSLWVMMVYDSIEYKKKSYWDN